MIPDVNFEKQLTFDDVFKQDPDDDVYEKAKEYLKNNSSISIGFLQRVHHISAMRSIEVIEKLEHDELIKRAKNGQYVSMIREDDG